MPISAGASLSRMLRPSARLAYVPVLAVAMGLMFVRTLLAARLLDMTEFGFFGAGILVSNFVCMFSCFGYYLLLQRELPMLIAKGQRQRGLLLMHQTLLLAAVICVALLPLSLLDLFSVSPSFFAISLLNGFGQQVFLVVTLQSRSEGRTMQFAIDNLLRATFVLVGITLTGVLFETAFSMLFVESLVTLMIVMRVYAVSIKSRLKRAAPWVAAGRGLMRINWGVPLTLGATGMVGFVVQSGDRWIAATLLSTEEFALYAFASIVLILAQSLQALANVLVFPSLAKTYVLAGSKPAALKAIRYSFFLLVVSGLLAVPALWMVAIGIERFFSAYAQSQDLLYLFALIAVLRLSDFFSSFLVIAGYERQLFSISIGSAALPLMVWLSYYGFNTTGANTVSIAWLAAIVVLLNYSACFLVSIQAVKAEQ